MKRIVLALCATAASALTATPAAAAVVFNGTNGSNLSAQATFDIVGGRLVLTLTNTSLVDVNDNPNMLHALFWDMASNPVLTYTSANMCNTCSFVGTTLNNGAGTNVGSEFAFKQDAGGLGQGITQDYGVSSAGYNIFGPGNVVAGAPDRGGSNQPPNGPDFGILSAGYIAGNDSNGMNNQQPFIKNSVIFDLGAFAGNLGSISNVRFQYDTALTGANFTSTPPVPEPATWAMMLLGFGGIGVTMRRGRKGEGRLAQIA